MCVYERSCVPASPWRPEGRSHKGVEWAFKLSRRGIQIQRGGKDLPETSALWPRRPRERGGGQGGRHSPLGIETCSALLRYSLGLVRIVISEIVSWDNSWSSDSCSEVPERCSQSYSRASISSHLMELWKTTKCEPNSLWPTYWNPTPLRTLNSHSSSRKDNKQVSQHVDSIISAILTF